MCSQRCSSSTTSNMVPSKERFTKPRDRARRMYQALDWGAENSYASSQLTPKQPHTVALPGRSWRMCVRERPISTADSGSYAMGNPSLLAEGWYAGLLGAIRAGVCMVTPTPTGYRAVIPRLQRA